ncbi:MAG: SIMPL domain-containing protein [Anaerolineales bacterium]|nr:SIMPL domain-containing protein [Anaerolineales bacterium]
MNRSTLRIVTTAAVAAAILFGGALAAGPWVGHPSTAQAQDNPLPAAPAALRTITVVGDGTVNIKPDVARANIGVETVNASVQEASGANKVQTDAVLAALKEAGIKDEDIQTSGYSVYAERFGVDGPLPDNQVQYRVSNTVTVLVRDLATLGQVLDTAITAGANNIYGVEFLLDDPTTARSAARKIAVGNASATAEELASLAGVKVGKLLSISEVIGTTGGVYSNQFTQYATGMNKAAAETPIEPGQLRLNLQLEMVYEWWIEIRD